jgi:bifunctional polynucleotide phosphatase/kinase
MKWTYLNSELESGDFTSDDSGFCYGSNRKNFRLPQRVTTENGVDNPSKIVAFDLDSTLIVTKTGRTFAKTADDWQWFSPRVPSVLNDYFQRGFRVIIITNQAGIKQSVPKLQIFQEKIGLIESSLRSEFPKVTFEVFCLNSKNVFRKPYPTLIDTVFFTGLSNNSFYCGDAAGRASDHSDSDYAFAYNSYIKFCTPEYLFHSDRTSKGILHKKNIDEDCNDTSYEYSQYSDKPELIIMVGYPGSGKSHVSKKIIEDSIVNHDSYDSYTQSHPITIVSLDNLKTRPKLYRSMKDVISKRQSLLVDNTSLSRADRTKLINILKEEKCRSEYIVRVVFVNRSMEDAYRLNCYRLYKNYKLDTKFVPERVYKMMRARYQMTSVEAEDVDIADVVSPGHPLDFAYYFHYA